MIEIKIPKEITEYKEKFLFGLTIRQCVCAVAALAVCVPLYIFGKDFLGDDVVGWLVILIAVPMFAFGFFRYDGMPFEKCRRLFYICISLLADADNRGACGEKYLRNNGAEGGKKQSVACL